MPSFKRFGSSDPDEPSVELRWNWNEQIDRAMDEITDVIEGAWMPAVERIYRAGVPVRTGELRGGLTNLKRTDYGRGGRFARVWRLSTDVRYARWVEYGTVNRGIAEDGTLREAMRRRRRTDGTKIRNIIKRRLAPG